MVIERVGKVNNISLKFHWEIDNFCISCKNVGDCLESPTFPPDCANNNITQWYLHLYPKGKPEDNNKDYLWFYLYANADTKAKGTLKMLNSAGKVALESIIDGTVFVKGTGYGSGVSRDFVVNPVIVQ